MNEPLPFKEPTELMEQTLNLVLTPGQCIELAIQGMDQVEAGEVKLRKAIATWVNDPNNGGLKELAYKVDLHRNTETSAWVISRTWLLDVVILV